MGVYDDIILRTIQFLKNLNVQKYFFRNRIELFYISDQFLTSGNGHSTREEIWCDLSGCSCFLSQIYVGDCLRGRRSNVVSPEENQRRIVFSLYSLHQKHDRYRLVPIIDRSKIALLHCQVSFVIGDIICYKW